MKRCLIIGCSETKTETLEKIPALRRYDGPTFRVLRRFLTESPADQKGELDVFVLSAEYGLIKGEHSIPVYDRRMTRHRAEELHPIVLDEFNRQIVSQNYSELFLSMGQMYLLALAGYENLLSPTTKVIISKTTSGRRLAELKVWLNGQEPRQAQLPLPLNSTDKNGHISRPVRGMASLQGVTLTLTPDKVYQLARQALAGEQGQPYNFKDWYVLVDGVKVAPKWLVSQLANLPVSSFDASAARRVLHALGIPIYRNE